MYSKLSRVVRYRALINNSLHEGSGDEKIYSPIEKSNSPWALPSRYMIFPGGINL